jgi:hypothetical protein
MRTTHDQKPHHEGVANELLADPLEARGRLQSWNRVTKLTARARVCTSMTEPAPPTKGSPR